MQILQRIIERQMLQLVGAGRAGQGAPPEVGLFPPDAVCRRVHGDVTIMMVGGVAALLLQMLHPGALAGVWDHSNFRRDTAGRLRRTAQFVGGTTYGSAAEADRLIARVRAIHDRVGGTLPDGTPYSANDPDLLAWVHVAGMRCFLEAHLRHRAFPLSPAEQDAYFAETATIARRLGAAPVPRTRRDAEAYLEAMRPHLRADARTREVARLVLDQPAPSLLLEPFRGAVMQGAVDLLPPWAARMQGLRATELRRPALNASLRGFGALTRWALQA